MSRTPETVRSEAGAVGIFAGGMALLFAVVALSREPDRAFSSAIVHLRMGTGLSICLQALGVQLLEPLTDVGISPG